MWLSYYKPSKGFSKHMNRIKLVISSVLCIFCIYITGCATYGNGVQKALESAKSGQYKKAEEEVYEVLSPSGVDRLLFHLEVGVLKHLQGEYEESNRLLEIAERISEDLENNSLRNNLTAFISNPRKGDYKGADFEKVFINYYKAINYMALGNIAQTRNAQLDAVESARIEARRLIIRLNALNSEKGSYANAKNLDEDTFAKVLDVFNMLIGNTIDYDQLEYRDDAMAHYLTGITYEVNGEYDNARISYQKSATAYEQGFADQFDLGSNITDQAWFDTIRMMRLAGGYENEWPGLASKKLTNSLRQQLVEYDGKSQLVVIEHIGMVPQRKEMNVQLMADPQTRSLILRPYALGSSIQNREKLAWFYLVYADKSLVNLMIHYKNNDFTNFLLNNFQKTIYLAGAWDKISDLGVINAIGQGMRITVPYYSPLNAKPGSSFVTIKGQADKRRFNMVPASSPAIMGINEQTLNANNDIRLALARGLFKAIGASRIAAQAGGDLGSLLSGIGQIASQLSDAAETRNWLMLPYEVRITRIPLDAGSYTVDMTSEVIKGRAPVVQDRAVVLQENDIQVMQVRSMPNANTVMESVE